MSVPMVLRAGTRDAHARLEHRLDLLSPALDRRRYGRVLAGLLALWSGWGDAHAAAAATRLDLPPPPRRAPLLRADLAHLGLDPEPPSCAPAALASAWAGIGAAYVLEGSALGGKVILRRLGRLGLSAGAGARFFAGVEAPDFASFLAALARLPDAAAAESLRGALAAFACFEARLCGAEPA